MLLVLQACFVVLVVTRRESLQQQKKRSQSARRLQQAVKCTACSKYLGIPCEEIRFHIIFLSISLMALVVYLAHVR